MDIDSYLCDLLIVYFPSLKNSSRYNTIYERYGNMPYILYDFVLVPFIVKSILEKNDENMKKTIELLRFLLTYKDESESVYSLGMSTIVDGIAASKDLSSDDVKYFLSFADDFIKEKYQIAEDYYGVPFKRLSK